jgi:hypothetical protein
MKKILAFLRKKYIYLIVAAGYVQWCMIVSNFVLMNYHFSFKILMIGLGFFGWYLIYVVVRKNIDDEDDTSKPED